MVATLITRLRTILYPLMLSCVSLALLFIPADLPILLAFAVFRHLVSHPRVGILPVDNGSSYTYILPHPGSMCQGIDTFQFDGIDAFRHYYRAYTCPLECPSYSALVRGPLFARRMSGLPLDPLLLRSIPDQFPFVIVGKVIGCSCLGYYRT